MDVVTDLKVADTYNTNVLHFIVPGRAVAAVRTTQRQKFVCKYYALYQAYKTFFTLIAKHAQAKRKEGWYAEKGVPVAIDVVVSLAGNRGVDVDNLLKSFMDASNGVLWHDDSQVWNASIEKIVAEGAGQEQVEITVKK